MGLALLLCAAIALFLIYGNDPASAVGNSKTTIGVSSIEVVSTGGGELLDNWYCEADHDRQSRRMPSGIYGIGDTIQVAVNFDGPLTVTGSPGLKIQVLTDERTAEWVSNSGSTVPFAYTVVEGDTDRDGISIRANRIVLGSGDSITDTDGNAVSLSHDVLSTQADHKVDGVRPRILFAKIPLQDNGMFYEGDTIMIQVKFHEPVMWKREQWWWTDDGLSNRMPDHLLLDSSFSSYPDRLTEGLAPRVLLDMGGFRVREAVLNGCPRGWWRDFPRYQYVRADDYDPDGVQVIPNSFTIPSGGWIKYKAGNDTILTHGTEPARQYNEVAFSPSAAILQSKPIIAGGTTLLTAIGTSGFTYRWTADDITIPGATGSTYTLTANEEGKTIRVYVYFTNSAGQAEITRSAGVGPVTNSSVTGQSDETEPANQVPAFDANVDTTLEVAENSPAGTSVGSAITATDPDDGDTLTCTLSSRPPHRSI